MERMVMPDIREAPTDRRNSRRYTLSVPVLFRWHDNTGERQGGGFTRNVSATGAYVHCDGESPQVATSLSIEVLLPPLDAQLAGLKLKAEGEVVRCGIDEGKGFAVRTDFAANEERLAR